MMKYNIVFVHVSVVFEGKKNGDNMARDICISKGTLSGCMFKILILY